MSQGNLAAAIGLANTSKIPAIGAYVQKQTAPGPGSEGPYVGVVGTTYWNRNVIDEDYTASGGILVASSDGAATGKDARWVSNTAQLTVPADGRCAVSAGGVVTAASGTGAFNCYLGSGTVVPANSFFWVFTR
jgi:hypothetical protein